MGADQCGDRFVLSLSIKIFLVFVLFWSALLRADFADDLARIHMEAIGGFKNLVMLKALRATGVTKIDGEELRFVMWAARPNLIRTETTLKERVLTQGWDGVNPPWLMDSKNGGILEMGAVAARAFDADAEFDDSLVLKGARRISVDYAGETEIDGKLVFKLLVTENFTESFVIYLDRSTYFIIRRDMEKPGAHGKEVVITEYKEFSPVNGVMLPHRIVQKVAGRVCYETLLEQIDANPPIKPGLFSRPLILVKP